MLKQLDEAEHRHAADHPNGVQAVFMLSSVEDAPESVTPKSTRDTVARIVEQAQKATGEDVERMNVFANLGSFVVQAPPKVVRQIIEDPRVASARANASSTPTQAKRHK